VLCNFQKQEARTQERTLERRRRKRRKERTLTHTHTHTHTHTLTFLSNIIRSVQRIGDARKIIAKGKTVNLVSEIGVTVNFPPSDLNQPLHFVGCHLAVNVTPIFVSNEAFQRS